MRQAKGLMTIVGLIVTATAVHADVPKEATILGQKYALEVHSLGGQYKNGLAVTLTDDTYRGTNVQFVAGDTPEKDRLFVVHAFGSNSDAFTADQFYLLTGADANGVFNQATSNLTQFFGGSVDFQKGGRPSTVTFISDVDTGVKKDRNIALSTFTDDDYLRFYDLDTLTGDFIGDAVFNRVQRCINADDSDPAMPSCGFITGALGPGGLMIFAGRGEGDGPQLSVLDPKQDKFFNVLTDLSKVTADQKIPFDVAQDPMDFERVAENEYLILGADPAGLAAERTRQVLYRARLTLPADLAKAAPESIKAEMLAQEELFNADTSKDLLGVGPTGIVGIAVGRAGANGQPRLYFTTADARIITANPE
jgi:hypothetical protein